LEFANLFAGGVQESQIQMLFVLFMIQLPAPPFPPRSPPPLANDFVFFLMMYGLFLEIVVLILPRDWRNRILEIAFPIFRRLW